LTRTQTLSSGIIICFYETDKDSTLE
jgi:hypothetical protein